LEAHSEKEWISPSCLSDTSSQSQPVYGNPVRRIRRNRSFRSTSSSLSETQTSSQTSQDTSRSSYYSISSLPSSHTSSSTSYTTSTRLTKRLLPELENKRPSKARRTSTNDETPDPIRCSEPSDDETSVDSWRSGVTEVKSSSPNESIKCCSVATTSPNNLSRSKVRIYKCYPVFSYFFIVRILSIMLFTN